MQKLTIKNGVIRWEKQNGDEVDFIRNFRIIENDGIKIIEKVSDNAFHLGLERILDDNKGTYLFLCEDTEINGKIYFNNNDLFDIFN